MTSESLRIVREHNAFRRSCINLQASENVMSRSAMEALASDMYGRYSHITGEGYNSYGGAVFSEEILFMAEALIARLYGSRYAEVRPIGGHIASEIVLSTMLPPGGRFLYVGPKNGGYPGYEQEYLPNLLGYSSAELPYLDGSQEVDIEGFKNIAGKERIDLIVLGQSAIVRPYDLAEISEVCRKEGIPIAYDGSHVMGLIAGGQFQPDALKYCDILFGSTHKSFFGPQGGIILTNDGELLERMRKRVVWSTMDNYHPSRVAALSVAAEEMLAYGREYAASVVSNSRELGRTLYDIGWEVRFPPWFSFSHQVLLSEEFFVKRSIKPLDFSRVMERNRIIVDRDSRLGLSEITRMGVKDMSTIAELMEQALRGEDVSTTVEKISADLKLEYGE